MTSCCINFETQCPVNVIKVLYESVFNYEVYLRRVVSCMPAAILSEILSQSNSFFFFFFFFFLFYLEVTHSVVDCKFSITLTLLGPPRGSTVFFFFFFFFFFFCSRFSVMLLGAQGSLSPGRLLYL